MPKTIVVCGYGPGISHAVAQQFGDNGFRVALVARRSETVNRAAAAFSAAGISARGFSCDLAQPERVTQLIADVRAVFGPIDVLHWNAYSSGARDLTSANADELRATWDVSVVGLVAALQASLPDLRVQPDAAVLVTGGGLARDDQTMNGLAVQLPAMGLALAKSAQHRLVALLNLQLRAAGIFVGEVMVHGLVRGTAADRGQGTLEASLIAQRFWELYQAREAVCINVP
jgi:NADP-dependent 3-hydroxy acid dehydrogenase YdfG